MNRFLPVTIMFIVAGCAGPGLEPDGSHAVQATAVGERSQPVQATEPDGEEVLAHNAAAETQTGIEDLEAPDASETPASMIPGRAEPEPQIVCERVVPTGSVLAVKVCRHKADVADKQEADQRIFDDIKRNTALGNSRL